MTRICCFVTSISLLVAACGATLSTASAATDGEPTPEQLKEAKISMTQWTHAAMVPTELRNGEEGEVVAALWMPPDVKTIRGLFYPGQVMIDKKLGLDGRVRAVLAELGMGVLYFPRTGRISQTDGKYIKGAVAALARVSGHPEVEFVPFLTSGHSAAGLFCRNVAYWNPDRVIAVVMIKSGNFHHGIEDMSRSLRGVPLIHFSGENEEFGPEGGNPKNGLREEYVTTVDGRGINQTQWVMTRMQMLERRRKHEDNLWTLVVDRGGRHTTWSNQMMDLFLQYLRSVCAARLPEQPWDGKGPVKCKPLTAKDGWLYDADIKNPKHQPAPYARYTGDKSLAFWVPDEAMAQALKAYSSEPWTYPDPTEGQPVEKRFYPPDMLKDLIDAPPPPELVWKGANGTWDNEGLQWLDGNRTVAWNNQCLAIFDGAKGPATILVTNKVTCLGLKLGANQVLDVGRSGIQVRWHARFDPASEVRLDATGTGWDRAGILVIDGNAELAGTLRLIPGEKELRPGKWSGLVQVRGLIKGDFTKIIAPEGWKVQWKGGLLCAMIPLPEKEKKPPKEDPLLGDPKKDKPPSLDDLGGLIDDL